MGNQNELIDQLEAALTSIRQAKTSAPPANGLRMPEQHILWIVAAMNNGEPVMPSDIAKRLNVTSAAVTHHLTSLEDRGLIARTSTTDDRRLLLVSLTKEGKTAVEDSKKQMRATMAGLVNFLGEDDSRTLTALVHKISQYVAEGGLHA